MKIYTINSGTVVEGAIVNKSVKADYIIDYIKVGEQGRGRYEAWLPVCPSIVDYTEQNNCNTGRVYEASLGTTKSGKPKLIRKKDDNTDKCIVIFNTKIGFRGWNDHAGDFIYEKESYDKFPGEIIVEGKIAQGAAGYAGSGSQIVAVIPKDSIFCTVYGGRLYGNPSRHFYRYDGNKIIGGLTDSERYCLDWF